MPSWLSTVAVFLHVVAAAFWVGGMLFLGIVVIPLLRDIPQRAVLIERIGRRFEYGGGVALLVLLVTGLVNLASRGITSLEALWTSPIGRMGLLKLGLFAVMVFISLWHSWAVGRRAVRLLQEGVGNPEAERMRQLSLWAGRIVLVLALALVCLGVLLARGIAIW